MDLCLPERPTHAIEHTVLAQNAYDPVDGVSFTVE